MNLKCLLSLLLLCIIVILYVALKTMITIKWFKNKRMREL